MPVYQGGHTMLVTGVLLFSILALGVSFLIFKKHEALEKAELSTYIVFIAWGSLLFGLFMGKFSY
jgi:hypothetical protein